ncbi:dethiobiotin synthase [Knoellia subterranea]|uniref:ATP-dependent dethiobiotin synthetase BioD n=1 Tax=Knoellia subterranea KCTC 19937 TaxID=1385521 RepID=A0A0A0JKC9_9MICO|nr:dethiobiotin synthase [Knoellia subterranea]KGN37523.1 dethiobiotin synthase [Knoellia subterranea KCTC 19937]
MNRFVVVTGTDTDVGKTVATAALAAWLRSRGRTVTVDKPTQTGVLPGERGDIDEVRRLAGVDGSEGVRLPDPMAPVEAATRVGAGLPTLADHVARLRGAAQSHDHVVVEGAGGLLVPLTVEGETIADLASALAQDGGEGAVDVVVVARAGLGTMNHTLLTLEALERRGLGASGVIIGSWPASAPEASDPVLLGNLSFFENLPVPLLACLPEGAGRLEPSEFQVQALEWFAEESSGSASRHSAALAQRLLGPGTNR